MLQYPSQYSPQGLMPQFTGLQATGFPLTGSSPFGQSSSYGFNGQVQSPFAAQQYPYSGQMGAGQQNPFQQSSFAQFHPQAQIMQSLAHLAQQMLTQGAITQQVGIALHQLCQQLAAQTLQTPQSGVLGAGSPFGQTFGLGSPSVGTPPFGAAGQSFGQPFTGATPGYGGIGAQGGFSPQAGLGWGAGRPPTIQ